MRLYAKLRSKDGDYAKYETAEYLSMPVLHVCKTFLPKQLGECHAGEDGKGGGNGELQNNTYDFNAKHGAAPPLVEAVALVGNIIHFACNVSQPCVWAFGYTIAEWTAAFLYVYPSRG